MAMRIIAMLFIMLIVASLGVMGSDAALQEAGTEEQVNGESWTVNIGTFVELEYSNTATARYGDDVTVKDANGNLVRQGIDYVWNAEDGTVKALSGGDLSDGESATIDYEFSLPSDEQQSLSEVPISVSQAFGLAAPAFVVIFFLVVLRG